MCLPMLAAIPAAAAGAGAPLNLLAGLGGAGAAGASGGSGLFTALSVLSAGLSAAGSAAQGQQVAASQNAQAESLERQAKDRQRIAAFEANRLREEGERIGGRQRAGILSSGVSIEGSPLDVVSDTAAEVALDQDMIRRNAKMRADEFRFEAGLARNNARSARIGGTIGAIAPFIDAGSNLLRFNRNRTRLVNQGV